MGFEISRLVRVEQGNCLLSILKLRQNHSCYTHKNSCGLSTSKLIPLCTFLQINFKVYLEFHRFG